MKVTNIYKHEKEILVLNKKTYLELATLYLESKMKQTFLFFFLLSFSKWRKTNSKCESLYIIIKKVYLITYVLQKDKTRFFFQKCAYFLQHKGVLFSDENLPKEDALFYEYVLHDHFRTFWWKLRNQMRKHIERY